MSDKKNKDNRKENTKSKKNTAVQTVVCLTVPNGTPLSRNFVLQRS